MFEAILEVYSIGSFVLLFDLYFAICPEEYSANFSSLIAEYHHVHTCAYHLPVCPFYFFSQCGVFSLVFFL